MQNRENRRNRPSLLKCRMIESLLTPGEQTPILVNVATHCGRERARESGLAGNLDVGCASSFAGKPAPTGMPFWHKGWGRYQL